MAITSTDILYLYSGATASGAAQTDPDASLGGYVSGTEIPDNVDNNLFDDVTGDEASAGDTEYRALFIKNNHANLTWQNVVAWIDTETPGADSIDIAVEGVSGDQIQTIADESTAPTGVTFSHPTTKETGISLGNLPAGSASGIWLKRIVPADCPAYSGNYMILKVEGDTPA